MRRKGFAAILVILVIVILGVVGYFGYKDYITKSQISISTTAQTASPTTTRTSEKTPIPQKVFDPKVTANWKIFSKIKGFTFKYPPNWTERLGDGGTYIFEVNTNTDINRKFYVTFNDYSGLSIENEATRIANITGTKIIENGVGTLVGGKKAIQQLIYTNTISNDYYDYILETYVSYDDENFYIIRGYCHDIGDLKPDRLVYDQILSTFKFTQ